MRALEINLFFIFVLCAPALITAMGVTPASTGCTATACQFQKMTYSWASSFQLKEIDFNSSPGQMAWDAVILAVTFPVYAFFWMLWFLSTIVLGWPALLELFHIPGDLANYFYVGIVVLWMLAYVQWKRGGLGTDASR